MMFTSQSLNNNSKTGYGIGWDVSNAKISVPCQSDTNSKGINILIPLSLSSLAWHVCICILLLTGGGAERVVREFAVMHGGGAVGGSSALVMVPEKKVVVALVVNVEAATPSPTKVALRLAPLFYT